MNRIEEHFDSYRAKVVPRMAFDIQINETRLAFYAGVASMFSILQKIGEDSITPERGEKILEEIAQELNRFGERQKEIAESKKIQESILRGTK